MQSNNNELFIPENMKNKGIKFLNIANAKSRYDICKSCNNFLNLTKQCSVCKCFMSIKVMLPGSSCPINKWEAINV